MISKNCDRCNANIIWPENYIEGQKFLNLDGGIHFCVSTKPSNIGSNKTSIIPIPEIVKGHTKLIAKLLLRIERLEKKGV